MPGTALSGRKAQAGSARSEKRGITFTSLPKEGYVGPVPKFPLPQASAREHEFWKEIWTTPQAAGWAIEPWRHPTVAMYVRTFVRCEDDEVPAGVLAQLTNLANQIGLTSAGLAAIGWQIADPELEQQSATVKQFGRSRDRLKIVK
jgi:hypothetical protein